MVFQWATREGFSFGDAFAYYQLDSKVEQYSAEGAALFDARVDWDGRSLPKWCDNLCGGACVHIANHGYEVRWESHVGEGGQQRRVRNATKGVVDVKPGKTERASLAMGIIDYRLQQKSVFVASFRGSRTFLLLR